jgi:hypothetical protein
VNLELPPIGWILFILGSSQSDSTAFPSSLDTYATRLLAEPLIGRIDKPRSWIKEGNVKTSELTMPEVGLIAATRGMLGAGIALLLADRLNKDQRKAIGRTLFLMGAASTIPLVIDVLSKRH